MTGPFDLPSRLVGGALDGLDSVAEAARGLPELQRRLLSLLTSLDERVAALPSELEQALAPYFEGQRADIQALRPELEQNRKVTESLPGHVDKLLAGLGQRMDALPAKLQQALRGHFESLEEAIGSLEPELRRTREAAEALPQRMEALARELEGVRAELAEVRAVVEPLQGPAERAARLSERLPGDG